TLPPRRSTPFPYTTLFRSEPGGTATVDAPTAFAGFGQSMSDRIVGAGVFDTVGTTVGTTRQAVRHNMVDELTYDPFGSSNHHVRSEEHTSELQSRGHLVCR